MEIWGRKSHDPRGFMRVFFSEPSHNGRGDGQDRYVFCEACRLWHWTNEKHTCQENVEDAEFEDV